MYAGKRLVFAELKILGDFDSSDNIDDGGIP